MAQMLHCNCWKLQVTNTTQLLQNFIKNYGVPPGQSSQVCHVSLALHILFISCTGSQPEVLQSDLRQCVRLDQLCLSTELAGHRARLVIILDH